MDLGGMGTVMCDMDQFHSNRVQSRKRLGYAARTTGAGSCEGTQWCIALVFLESFK